MLTFIEVNGYNADGLLITYGNPCQHIWTFVAGYWDNRRSTIANCPCAIGEGPGPPLL